MMKNRKTATIFTAISALRSALYVLSSVKPKNWKKRSPLTSLMIYLEFVAAKNCLWSCNSDSLENFAMPSFHLFPQHVRSDMWVYPHSAGQWKCHTRPVVRVASRLPHASQRRLHRIVHERDRPSQPRASRRSLHRIIRETQFGRAAAFPRTTATPAFSHFSLSTATLLAWKTDHSLTESTTKVIFVSLSAVKRSSWHPLDKSASSVMIGLSEHPNVCELPSVPIKLINVPI